jgi:quercetin dioxygenase-like cupin family protein
MIKSTLLAGSLLALISPAFAEGGMIAPDAVKWEPAPPALPPGAQAAVISGDPSSDGLYVMRLKLPDGYKVPAHNHPTSEYVTVLSGTFNLGMGDKLDVSKGQPLTAGGFAEAPANMNHFGLGERRDDCASAREGALRDHLCQSCGRSEEDALMIGPVVP